MSDPLPVLKEQLQLANIASAQLADLEQFDERRGPGSIVLELDAPLAYYVGRSLITFDRELRRVSALARSGRIDSRDVLQYQPERLWAAVEQPRASSSSRGKATTDMSVGRSPILGQHPDPPSVASLSLVAAEEGSALVALEVVGALVSLFTSQPLTALVNAAAMSGPIHQLRAFLRRRPDDDLSGVSARQALSVLKEFRHELPEALQGEEDSVVPLSATAGPYMRLPDGTSIRASRRIHYVQQNQDGTMSWFVIE